MKNTLIIIIVLLSIFAVLGCSRTMGKKEENPDKSGVTFGEDMTTIFAINTTKVIKGQLLNYLEINGDVITESKVDVYAEAMGKLTSLNVSIGDRIEKDAIIGEVDPSRPGMKYAKSPIKSPITGTVTSLPVYIGSTVSPSVPVATISKMDSLRIRTYVAERFISKMKVGIDAIIRLEAFPEESFSATVSELSPVVDPLTRTMEVNLDFKGQYDKVKAGMFAEIKIITERKNGILKIPADCLVKRYGGYFVFVVKDNATVEKRAVTTGILIDNKLEILKGLKAGEEIVIRGQTLLEDNAKVKVIERIEPLHVEDIIR
ncbi:MAG: efflux RND transporter periplasmic adaptor subunit [Spirochaetales bacterium]|nr:efflux RND transporter periplasmic adaptor subunit [Spirochaetales bacterium]